MMIIPDDGITLRRVGSEQVNMELPNGTLGMNVPEALALARALEQVAMGLAEQQAFPLGLRTTSIPVGKGGAMAFWRGAMKGETGEKPKEKE